MAPVGRLRTNLTLYAAIYRAITSVNVKKYTLFNDEKAEPISPTDRWCVYLGASTWSVPAPSELI